MICDLLSFPSSADQSASLSTSTSRELQRLNKRIEMPPKLISQPSHPAHKLLAAAHPPSVATDLFNDKIVTKPYRLRGTTTIDNARDARSTRRKHRLRQKKHFLAHQKPRPLSAKEKRESGLYDVKAELGKEGGVKYEVFEALNKIWMGYILEVLDLGAKDGEAKFEKVLLPDAAGPKIAAADFHGAEIKVVRSRCVGRVGTRGIVVRDTKFTFVIVTKGDKVKSMVPFL